MSMVQTGVHPRPYHHKQSSIQPAGGEGRNRGQQTAAQELGRQGVLVRAEEAGGRMCQKSQCHHQAGSASHSADHLGTGASINGELGVWRNKRGNIIY